MSAQGHLGIERPLPVHERDWRGQDAMVEIGAKPGHHERGRAAGTVPITETFVQEHGY